MPRELMNFKKKTNKNKKSRETKYEEYGFILLIEFCVCLGLANGGWRMHDGARLPSLKLKILRAVVRTGGRCMAARHDPFYYTIINIESNCKWIE